MLTATELFNNWGDTLKRGATLTSMLTDKLDVASPQICVAFGTNWKQVQAAIEGARKCHIATLALNRRSTRINWGQYSSSN